MEIRLKDKVSEDSLSEDNLAEDNLEGVSGGHHPETHQSGPGVGSENTAPYARGSHEWNVNPGSVPYAPRKGALLLLTAVAVIGIILGAFFFWYVPSVGLKSIHPALPYVAGAIILATALFILSGVFVVTFMLIRGRLPGRLKSAGFRGLVIKFFMPLMIMAGTALRIPRIKIERAFLEINNNMVRDMVRDMVKKGKGFAPEKVVVLMPHCIQFDDCALKVTRDVRNCAGCGKCEIGELIELADTFKMELFVLTGGTVARRRLAEFRPNAVVAVACERDLTSGIQDAYPLPVLGIINKRPRGYCVETGVAIEDIKDAINDLLGAGAGVEAGPGPARAEGLAVGRDLQSADKS